MRAPKCLTPFEATQRLHVDFKTLSAMQNHGKIFATRDRTGWSYPAFQFADSHIRPCMEILLGHMRGWSQEEIERAFLIPRTDVDDWSLSQAIEHGQARRARSIWDVVQQQHASDMSPNL